MSAISRGRGNFRRDIKPKIDADPELRALVDHEKQEAIAHHIAENLADLRTMRQVTQAAVAEQLAIAQSNVSRIEHGDDWLLSTLKAYVEGIGGRLELAVVFDDERVPLDLFGDEELGQVQLV